MNALPLLAANEDDTVWCADLFDVGWRDAPHRVPRNSTVRTWEAANRPASGRRPAEGEVIATRSGRDMVRYQSATAGSDTEGEVEAMSLWAGQGVALVRKVQPAAEIVREINDEARRVLASIVAVLAFPFRNSGGK